MRSSVSLFPVFETSQLFLNLPGFTCKFFILAQGQRRALESASLGFKRHHLLVQDLSNLKNGGWEGKGLATTAVALSRGDEGRVVSMLLSSEQTPLY